MLQHTNRDRSVENEVETDQGNSSGVAMGTMVQGGQGRRRVASGAYGSATQPHGLQQKPVSKQFGTNSSTSTSGRKLPSCKSQQQQQQQARHSCDAAPLRSHSHPRNITKNPRRRDACFVLLQLLLLLLSVGAEFHGGGQDGWIPAVRGLQCPVPSCPGPSCPAQAQLGHTTPSPRRRRRRRHRRHRRRSPFLRSFVSFVGCLGIVLEISLPRHIYPLVHFTIFLFVLVKVGNLLVHYGCKPLKHDWLILTEFVQQF